MSDKTAITSQLLEAGETGEKIAKAAPALLMHRAEAKRFASIQKINTVRGTVGVDYRQTVDGKHRINKLSLFQTTTTSPKCTSSAAFCSAPHRSALRTATLSACVAVLVELNWGLGFGSG